MTAFPTRWSAEIRTPAHLLAAAGLAALLAGTVVYVFWRSPGSSMLLPAALQLAHSPAPPLTGQLPALLHAYAFTLFTVIALGVSSRHAAVAGIAWTAAGGLLETAQVAAIAERLSAALAGIGSTGTVSAYLTRGTFDPLDICATALGALAAFVTVVRVLRKGETHENQKIIRTV